MTMINNDLCVAVLGASYLQKPIYKKLRELNIRSVGISWDNQEECVTEGLVDTFHQISIIEKEKVLEVCKRENINAILSIASDVAVPTIAYVAQELGLTGNSLRSAEVSTNKLEMRSRFMSHGLPSPKFAHVKTVEDVKLFLEKTDKKVILKPVDRSGSMGVQIIDPANLLNDVEKWVSKAVESSFSGEAIIEEFIPCKEISVEYISFKGKHYFLNTTDKVTSGDPHFVETEQHQPAILSESLKLQVMDLVPKALDSLDIKYGASHTELMIDENEQLWITEIGARMGGDFIGSTLTELSTGYDFVKGVINCALGRFEEPVKNKNLYSGIYFLSRGTEKVLHYIKDEKIPEIKERQLMREELRELTKSSDRSGYFIYQSSKRFYMD